MEQYIKKSDIVAEIERLINSHEPLKTLDPTYCEGLNDSLDDVLSFLDTLKVKDVKDVDFEKEIDKFYGMYRKDGQTFLLEDNEECVDWKTDCNPEFEMYFAKYFYELGLKSKG